MLYEGTMDFSNALQRLKDGHYIARQGWNGKDMWLRLVDLEETDALTKLNDEMECAQFILMKTADRTLVPWVASQTDLLADDWILVDV